MCEDIRTNKGGAVMKTNVILIVVVAAAIIGAVAYFGHHLIS